MATVNSIKEARRAAGFSQAQLAKKLRVSRGAVAQWEMRKGTRPDPNNAIKLTRVLPGLTLDVIFAKAA